MRQLRRRCARLEKIIAARVDPDLYVATLEGVKTPEQELIERQEWRRVDHLIDKLPVRNALALRLWYGIRCEPHTLAQVAEKFGVGKARIGQLIAHGERILRRRVLLQENPKLLRELQASEDEKQRDRLARLHEKDAARLSAINAHLLRVAAEREAHRQKRMAEQAIVQAQIQYDWDYVEACDLNDQWENEVRRRAETELFAAERQRLRERRAADIKRRDMAFRQQVQDLCNARDAYFASRGTAEEAMRAREYIHHMNDWGPRHDRIWKEHP